MAKSKKQAQGQQRSGNPARRSQGAGSSSRPAAPPASPMRAALNRRSAGPLLWMHGLPRWVVPVVMGLCLAAGLFLDGSLAWLGTLLLLAVALFVAWLYALSWPVLAPSGRFARGLVLVALIGFTGLKASGRL